MKNPPFDSLVWGSLRLAPNTVLVTVAFLIGYQCLQEWENHQHSTVEDSQNGLCTKKFTKTKNSRFVDHKNSGSYHLNGKGTLSASG